MIKHLACIMDGNRRWAKKQNRVPWYGHKEGVEAVKRVVRFCLEQQISYLSLYTFSLENFRRSPIEQQFLFKLLVEEAERGIDEFIQNEIGIQFVGDRTLFPQEVIPACQMIEEKTAHLNKLKLNFLFCYGARQEIVSSIKTVITDVQEGRLQTQELTEELFQQYLWTGAMPEPDLIIRTGGFKRLSNFLLYQSAYSEFCFLDCLWPELTTQHLQEAVAEFVACRRNFGT